MSDSRDLGEQLKITDADGEVRPADRTEAGVKTGSTSMDDAGDSNRGVLGDVAHPFDQTNGILDAYDEHNAANPTGESPSEYAAAAGPAGRDAPQAGTDADDSYTEDGARVVPPPLPPAGR